MKKIEYADTWVLLGSHDTFTAHITKFNDKDSLLKHFAEQFHFNDYYLPYSFGFNWDALIDSLCDLSWIKEQNVIISHSKPFCLNDKDYKIYVDILQIVVNFWEDFHVRKLNARVPTKEEMASDPQWWGYDNDHNLSVVFPKSEEKHIKQLLKEIDRERR